MVRLLRIVWPIVALILTILLIGKFILAARFGEASQVAPAAFGVFLCFYLLFMLEGLQVAGLQVKDLEGSAIDHFLERHPVGSRKQIFPAYTTFASNFDGFVTGRQIFVIMTVVAIGLLIKGVRVPLTGSVSTEGWLKTIIDFVNDANFPKDAPITPFAFISATLVPAWWCQLLSQFLADGRAISFIALPGSRPVLRLAMFLDQLQLGEPPKVALNVWSRLTRLEPRQQIPIGKQTYYDASVNFYGRAKKRHEISFALGKPTTVRETINYVFHRGNTESLYHTIQVSGPVQGDIKGKIDLPENVHMQVEARDTHEDGLYTYWIKFLMNQSLPREGVDVDEVILQIEYQTYAYSGNMGVPQTIEFSSPLPTEAGKILIQGGNRLLKKPKLRIIEAEDKFSTVPDDGGAKNWEVSTPEPNNNRADILIDHPTVATIYQIEFEIMDVPA